MNFLKLTTLATALLISMMACNDDDDTLKDNSGEGSSQPVIIAHRGAQSVYPEHTLVGYEKASELGADFIEPDLVLTKDGYFVSRHEPMLSNTTNVSELEEFADLKTTKNLDGKQVTDWFVSDFTLEQIKKLKAKQAYEGRDTTYDNQFEIPTFDEILELRQTLSETRGTELGIYPELKHPYFHDNIFGEHYMEDKLIATLDSVGLNTKEAAIYVQCFEVASLQYLNSECSVKLVQLISTYAINNDGSLDFDVPDGEFISNAAPYDFYMSGDERTYEYFATSEGMAYTATYAEGIGPWKPFIISYQTEDSGDLTLLDPSDFVELAHANGLKVHPYTFRNENTQWSGGDPEKEYHLFFDAGVDGVFTDYTNEAVSALETWEQ